jgi:hypothetical protein
MPSSDVESWVPLLHKLSFYNKYKDHGASLDRHRKSYVGEYLILHIFVDSAFFVPYTMSIHMKQVITFSKQT